MRNYPGRFDHRYPNLAAGLKILIPIEPANLVKALNVFWKPQRRDLSKILVESASIRREHESAIGIADVAEAMIIAPKGVTDLAAAKLGPGGSIKKLVLPIDDREDLVLAQMTMRRGAAAWGRCLHADDECVVS